MKKLSRLIMSFAFLSCYLPVHAQSANGIGSYFWKDAVLMDACNSEGTLLNRTELSITGQEFLCVKIKGGKAIIFVSKYKVKKWKWNGVQTDSTEYKQFNMYFPDGESEGVSTETPYFSVDTSDLTFHAQKVWKEKSSFSIGVMNIPFKIRPQKGKFDFSGAINLGTSFQWNIAHRNYRRYHGSVLAGFSITSVTLDSVSVARNAPKLTSSNNFSAISLCLGFGMTYQKAQIGIFTGVDYINRLNHETYGWNYQGQPWISLAIGFTIFETEERTSPVKGSN